MYTTTWPPQESRNNIYNEHQEINMHQSGGYADTNSFPKANLNSEGQMSFLENPNKQSGLRNSQWISFFAACLISYTIMLMYGSARGNLGMLSRVVNYQGLACGWDSPVKHLPYLYLPLATTKYASGTLRKDRALCVARCPDDNDVLRKGTISVPESLTVAADDDLKKISPTSSSAISVVFNVNSPIYSTSPVGSVLCYPKEPALQTQFASFLKSSESVGVRFLTGGLLKALPVGLFCIFASGVVAISASVLLRVAPGIMLMSSVISTGILFLVAGLKLIFFASGSRTSGSLSTDVFSLQYSTTTFVGSLCLVLSILTWITVVLSWHHFAVCVKLLEVTGDILSDLPSIHVVPLGMSFITCCWSVISVIGYALIISVVNPATPERVLSLNPNGGIGILPLHRTLSVTPGTSFAALAWIFISFWFFEVLLSIERFVGVHAGILWYFSPLDYKNERQKIPGFSRAILKSCISSLGSLVAVSLFRCLIRPLTLLFYGLSTRFQFTSNGFTCLNVTEHFMSVDVGPGAFLRDMVDHNSNAVFAEMALQGATLQQAIQHAGDCTSENYSDPAARLFGLAAYATWSISASVALSVFLICISIFLPMGPLAQQTGSRSVAAVGNFISSPIISAMFIALVAGMVTALFVGVWEAVGDGALYALMNDSPKWNPKNQELALRRADEYNRFIDGKLGVPSSLRDLLSFVAEDRTCIMAASQFQYGGQM